MKFLMLNGPSCSGKSTIVKRIMVEKEGYYHISYDALKWGFSQYKPEKHYAEVRKLVRALTDTLGGMGYNILCDSGLYRETREKLFLIVKRHEYEIIEVNLEASYPVLEERFNERVTRARTTPGGRISNTDPARHKELFSIYEAEKNPLALTFRTDEVEADKIVSRIIALL